MFYISAIKPEKHINILTLQPSLNMMPPVQKILFGAIAQLGERLHGMQEVSGSIPLSSTKSPLFSILIYLIVLTYLPKNNT